MENVEIEDVTYNSPPKTYEPEKTVEYDNSNKMAIVTFNADPSKSKEDKNQKILDIEPISHTDPILPIPSNSVQTNQTARQKYKTEREDTSAICDRFSSTSSSSKQDLTF
jgi:hypothetical protein